MGVRPSILGFATRTNTFILHVSKNEEHGIYLERDSPLSVGLFGRACGGGSWSYGSSWCFDGGGFSTGKFDQVSKVTHWENCGNLFRR
jgi:hypothetical protein